MKDIDYSLETPTSGQPLSGESFAHMRDGINETTAAIVKGLMSGAYSANDVVIIYGCVDSGTAGVTYNISAGAVLYNGEIYLVDATGVLTISGNVAVATIATTYNAIDPVTFTDLTTHSVHRIKKVSIALATSGTGIKDYSAFKTIQRSIVSPVLAKNTTTQSDGSQTTRTLKFNTIISNVDGITQTLSSNGEFSPKAGLLKFTISCNLNEAGGGNTETINLAIYKGATPGTETLFTNIVGYRGRGSATEVMYLSGSWPIVCAGGTESYKIVISSSSATTFDITNALLQVEAYNNVKI